FPAGSVTSTLARQASAPHAEPRRCSASHCLISSEVFRLMPSAKLEADPTEISRRRPSGENARSRVECPPVVSERCGTITSGCPAACKSPFLYAKRTTALLFATYSHFGSLPAG